MSNNEFLWHAKRGHGECILEMKKGNNTYHLKAVKKIFLNNYAFLLEDEYRSSYSCELVSFYNNDKYFLSLLWDKIKRTKIEDYYTFDYLVNNLYFILKRNKNHNYEKKVEHLFTKALDKGFFTENEQKSICSLISLTIDLNINSFIQKIIKQHYSDFKNSNLDVSYIEYYYNLKLSNKNSSVNIMSNEVFDNFDSLLECISNDLVFNKKLPLIVNKISNEDLKKLLGVLDNDNIDNSLKTNILKLILYSKKRDAEIIKTLISIVNNSTQEQKSIIYEILTKTKSKKALSVLRKNELSNSFYVRLLLNNYNKDEYESIHKKILKLRINYTNLDNWFEVEADLIKYCNRKDFDKRLLTDLKYFLKNGLSSNSRYKIAKILTRYNVLDDTDIKSLKYDADFNTRRYFENV